MAMAPLRLDRALIQVSGPDARSFLQGLLTQNLDRLDAGAPLYAGLLSPQGKVIADMILWPEPGVVLIDADPARGADLLRRLTMYKLRAAVEIADVSAEQTIALHLEASPGATPDPRALDGALGWRQIASNTDAASLAPGEAALLEKRIALGVPDLAVDAAPEEVFALEALFEELHGVDFQKGCFVGQENVSRMKRRATTRKKFCPMVVDGDAPAFGTPVRAGDAEIGSIRSGVAGRALALLRLDRALDAQAKGIALIADGRTLELDPPPWLIPPQDETP